MDTNKHISLFAFALSCLFAFALFSCGTEDFPPINGDEHGYIITTVSTPRAGNAFEFTDYDHVLHSLRIFVFVGNQLETQSGVIRRFYPGTTNQTAQWTAWENDTYHRLQVTLGTKEILVVANETAAMTPELDAVQTMGALHGVMTDPIESVFIFDPNQGLPMTGRTTREVTVEHGSHPVTITLTRIMAKLDMTIIDGSELGDIEIYSVTLFNNNRRSWLWERSNGEQLNDLFHLSFNVDNNGSRIDLGATPPFWGHNMPVNRGTGDRWEFPTLYLYENRHGKTRLEIKAIIYPCHTYPVHAIYFVYIGEECPLKSEIVEGTPTDGFILRGRHYTLTGTIWGIEDTNITVKIEAETWQVGNSEPQRPLPPPTAKKLTKKIQI